MIHKIFSFGDLKDQRGGLLSIKFIKYVSIIEMKHSKEND